ncbi:uncharacterized protein DUF58 [Murinocardiopsis flavida]|uniref:Uncharacterized protein DUF58 n=1 Tax=Murinocardiopsis flavida TaxID=645275 RepID=A0A2P8DMP1_9ACTN|nr:DUF58 domain-containing protein [Murinocardiopsis flavida]PSK98474.1 uncharacterized protein DUF58 [Murinocardiopsis flavida]
MSTAELPGRDGERALRALDLPVRRRLEGLLHGDHAGLRSGQGSEPDEARPYQPGQDDVRRMDWNVTARSVEPHVRAPLAEREMQTWVLVDASASMDFGTALLEKRELATAAVAAVGLLTDGPGNRLGARVARGDALELVPAGGGRAARRRLLRTLLARPGAPPGAQPPTDLARCLARLHRDHPRPGLRVVVSDFHDGADRSDTGLPPWTAPLRRLAARHEVIAAEVIDPRELELPDVGLVTLVDPVSGRRRDVPTGSRLLRDRYAAAARAHRERNAAAFRAAGAAHLKLHTDRDWVREIAVFTAARRRSAARRPPTGRARIR